MLSPWAAAVTSTWLHQAVFVPSPVAVLTNETGPSSASPTYRACVAVSNTTFATLPSGLVVGTRVPGTVTLAGVCPQPEVFLALHVFALTTAIVFPALPIITAYRVPVVG